MILILIYSANLRVSEVFKLRVEDIDTERRLTRIKGGKSRKDHYTFKEKYLYDNTDMD